MNQFILEEKIVLASPGRWDITTLDVVVHGGFLHLQELTCLVESHGNMVFWLVVLSHLFFDAVEYLFKPFYFIENLL